MSIRLKNWSLVAVGDNVHVFGESEGELVISGPIEVKAAQRIPISNDIAWSVSDTSNIIYVILPGDQSATMYFAEFAEIVKNDWDFLGTIETLSFNSLFRV